MDGADVGESAFIGAGALVTPRTVVPPRTLWLGSPGPTGARPLRRGGRGPEALPPQLPRLQGGVLPGRREVGAVTARVTGAQGHARPPSAREREVRRRRGTARRVFGSYGYGEIRTPIFESTELFARSVGETTDIVHKEMYTFPDRKGRSLTLRPENTAGVVRALVEKGLAGGAQADPPLVRGSAVPLRAAAGGPLPRVPPDRRRARRRRRRPAGDAEVLAMLFAFLRALGLTDALGHAQLHSERGGARGVSRRRLQEHVRPHAAGLGPEDRSGSRRTRCASSIRRIRRPRRDPRRSARATLDFLDEASRAHHEELKRLLAAAGVRFSESAVDRARPRLLHADRLRGRPPSGSARRTRSSAAGATTTSSRTSGARRLRPSGFAIGEDRLVEAMTGDARPIRDALLPSFPTARSELLYALGVAGEIRSAPARRGRREGPSGPGHREGPRPRGPALQRTRRSTRSAIGRVHAVLLGRREREENP